MRRLKRGSSSMMLVAESHAPHDDIIVMDGVSDVRLLGTVFWWQALSES